MTVQSIESLDALIEAYGRKKMQSVKWKGLVVSLPTKEGKTATWEFHQLCREVSHLWKKIDHSSDQGGLTSLTTADFIYDLLRDQEQFALRMSKIKNR